ncbi:NF045616 family extracytoplasmic (lipo)protein [Acinetobacter sp. YH16057]|uniref:NF045616 family extracytoplasmic (lipo)protein n=1 Tax=Acinetobacter sp. YH16057 TaxID=2601195 RepID=UPI0015D32A06|nr:NF045616 family extracytoplasmic (lipo)protein [Acinetobacter sp. YH16057]
MKILSLLILLFSTNIFADQLHEPLYLIKKQNSLCIYTNNPSSKLRDDHITLISLGIPGSNAGSVSETIIKNLVHPPIYEENCLSFSLKNIRKSGPYSVVLDMDKTYAANFCITVDDQKKISIHKQGSQLQCQKSIYNNPFNISLEIKKNFIKIKSFLNEKTDSSKF